MEFINSAPCPISIDRESFFRVDLEYGEVLNCYAVLLFLAQERKVSFMSRTIFFESISESFFFAFGDPYRNLFRKMDF